ncbi:MAG: DoxX family membrane protein [Verrucomicrobiae bacterium]|nr:DoxX family membrane protein [Verrucomicrobiae bacterium]
MKNRWFLLALRWGIGAMFIYAGAMKMISPQPFADSIDSFKILPNLCVSLFALCLPPFEVGVGALMLAGPFKRMASLGVLLLSGVFLVALSQALIRGLKVDCGCFGSSPEIYSSFKVWLALIRDIFLVVGAWWLYRRFFEETEPVEVR